MFKKISYCIMVTLLLLQLVGCGSKNAMETSASLANGDISSNKNDSVVVTQSENKGSTEAPQSKSEGTNITLTTGEVNSGHKVIQTGEINIETLRFDDTVAKLTNYVVSIGGYTESSNINGRGINNNGNGIRAANFIFRIPQGKYTQTFSDVQLFGTVVYQKTQGEDITDKYFDSEARLKSLRIQNDRLMAILEKATKLEDIIKLEKEIQTTVYEIERYTGTIKKWDSLVSFSSLTINVSEVQEIKPVQPDVRNSLFDRMAYGFKKTMSGMWSLIQNILVFLVAAIPVIIPIGLICWLVYYIAKKRRKRITRDEIQDTNNVIYNKRDEKEQKEHNKEE